MGRRGPAPTPTSLLKLRGSWRADLRKGEPKPDALAPRYPSWLDADAKAKWKQLVPKLMGMRVLTNIDGDALTNYCQVWSRWKKSEEFIAKHGAVYPIKNEDGNVKYLQQVPQISIARTLLHILNRYQQEFGMTPASRTRVRMERRDEPFDKLEAILSGAGDDRA